MDIVLLNYDDSTKEYVPRLLEAGEKGDISLGKLHICTKDSVDIESGKVVVHNEDGIDFLVNALNDNDEIVSGDNQLVPSHDAPHVLALVIVKLLKMKGYKAELMKLEQRFNTPCEVDLEDGLKAISYADSTCPLECIEHEVCKINGEEIEWDIEDKIKLYVDEVKVSIDLINFRCEHFTNLVSTIPMKKVVDAWNEILRSVENIEYKDFLIATHSKCHGIVAYIRVKEEIPVWD